MCMNVDMYVHANTHISPPLLTFSLTTTHTHTHTHIYLYDTHRMEAEQKLMEPIVLVVSVEVQKEHIGSFLKVG